MPLFLIDRIKQILRNNDKINKMENEYLTRAFNEKVLSIKEYNSKVIFDTVYIPKAIETILKEENYLTNENGASPLALAMLINDYTSGVLDVFYRPVEEQ